MPAQAGAFRRLALFGSVYFVQGAVLTFFSTFNVLYLRTFDIAYSRIGIVSGIALIPFVLKIFIGLLSDRVSPFNLGHRKPYILFGLILQGLAFTLVLTIQPDKQFGLYTLAMLLAALGMSTYDTTTDGFSIDTTPEQERGKVQGVMVGGRALSAVLVAALFGYLSQRGQWSTAFWLVVALSAALVPLALSVDEGRASRRSGVFSKADFRGLLNMGFLLFVLLGLIYPLALYSANGMIGAYLNEALSIPLDRVGLYISVFGIGTIAGAVGGGAGTSGRIGRRTSLLAALFLSTVGTLGLALVPSPGLAWGVVFLFGAAFGYYETVYMAMAMDACDPAIAAFTFSIIMAMGNVGIGLGAPLAGVLVDAIGFQGMFITLAAVNLAALPLVFAIFKQFQAFVKPAAAG